MTRPSSLETERQALALFERLVDDPGNQRLRERLLRDVPEAVRLRITALEESLTQAARALPTQIGESIDGDGDAIPPPSRIGVFRLTERVGRGGMGDVWAARRDDGLFDQMVAIKLIQRRSSGRMLAAFDDERRFLARLEHPNIARLIDGGVAEGGLPWLAMEFCDGRPIDEAAAGLPAAERVHLFIKAADAIRFAHNRIIAHADIKPSNILVSENGQVKLLDFGIAALIDETQRSAAGTGPLTRAFASPQRLAGAGPSVADDLFGLGRTLAAVLDGIPDRELAAIVAKASAAEEADRYGSVDALVADLDRWRARLPVGAVPDSWRYRARKFIDRNRRGVIAAAVAFVLLGGVSTFAVVSYFRGEVSRGRAEARLNEVRHLSHYILYDLYDQLARQPGTVAKREQIAELAARYLGQLQADQDASPALRLDAARSYRRLAMIAGLPRYSNVGRPDIARMALDKAGALLDSLITADPRHADALAERGWVSAERWALGNDGSADDNRKLGEAQGYFTRALAIAPDHRLAQLGAIGLASPQAFDLIYRDGHPARAVPLLRKALVDLRARPWPAESRTETQSLEIMLLQRLGDAVYYSGDIVGALPPYREADGLIDSKIARDGPTPQAIIEKAENAFNISGTLGDMRGRDGEALAIANAGVPPLELLLRAGPDAGAEKRLLMLYGQQALLHERMGQLAAALQASTSGLRLREARMARHPDYYQDRRDLAIGLMPHAELLARLGKPDEACLAARRAERIWRSIADRHEMGEHDRTRELPRASADVRAFCR